LARALAGLDEDARGSISLGGKVTTVADALKATARPVAYLDQSNFLWPHLSVRRAVDLVTREHDSRKESEAYAGDLGIPEFWDRRPDRLSGGERQRASVLLGLSARPRVLIVDEPTSQLDMRNRRRVVDALARASRTMGIVIITHDLPIVRYLSGRAAMHAVWYMSDGRVQSVGSARDWLELTDPMLRAFVEAVNLSDGSSP
jgi:ABC-type dipeptide/oligopeptide/nickel transport system ATPase subunit